MAYPFVHPDKMKRLGALLSPAKKPAKRGPKGPGKEDTIVSPEKRAWLAYKMRREALMNELLLPSAGDTDGSRR